MLALKIKMKWASFHLCQANVHHFSFLKKFISPSKVLYTAPPFGMAKRSYSLEFHFATSKYGKNETMFASIVLSTVSDLLSVA